MAERFEHDGATLQYSQHGPEDGAAILALAPGGLTGSREDNWSRAPWNPVDQLAELGYRVVAMDQRNTGTSAGPVGPGDGWATYAADQLVLLDHLGIDRFGVIGMCIGGAFIMELLQTVPDRVAAAVAMQPIGSADNESVFDELFAAWRDGLDAERSDITMTDADWADMRAAMFPPDRTLFSIADADVAAVTTPLLVLRGNDEFHPSAASEFLAATAPNASLVQTWKDPADQPAARQAVEDFFAEHLR